MESKNNCIKTMFFEREREISSIAFNKGDTQFEPSALTSLLEYKVVNKH